MRDPRPPHDPTDEEIGLTTLIGNAVEDAKNVARAEIALAKARLVDRIATYKAAAILFAAAAVLALAALIALLVGLIGTLATLTGPGWATLIVVGATLVVVAILALVGKARLTKRGDTAR